MVHCVQLSEKAAPRVVTAADGRAQIAEVAPQEIRDTEASGAPPPVSPPGGGGLVALADARRGVQLFFRTYVLNPGVTCRCLGSHRR